MKIKSFEFVTQEVVGKYYYSNKNKEKTMSKRITFEESLAHDDWGLIIDKNGQLKGLFIPDGSDENDVPESIINLCCSQFGINPQEFDDTSELPQSLH
jgi:hypothetical protein